MVENSLIQPGEKFTLVLKMKSLELDETCRYL